MNFQMLVKQHTHTNLNTRTINVNQNQNYFKVTLRLGAQLRCASVSLNERRNWPIKLNLVDNFIGFMEKKKKKSTNSIYFITRKKNFLGQAGRKLRFLAQL